MKTCIRCTKPVSPSGTKYCSRNCYWQDRSRRFTGSNHPKYKEKLLDKDGYILIHIGNKVVREHRFVVESHIGRRLEDGEIVHHKNGNRTDNRIKNLEIMTQADHVRHHRTINIEKRIIDKFRNLGWSFRKIGRELGVNHSTVIRNYNEEGCHGLN